MTPTRILFLALLVAACSPFNPKLGEDPFLCGMTEPRCPDGYGPVVDQTRCLCKKGIALPDGGGGQFTCNDDSLVTGDPGGNETFANPTPTTIGQANSAAFSDMSICPATDQDVFAMTINVGNTNIEVRVLHDFAQGVLDLAILNSQGAIMNQGIEGIGQVTATYLTPSAGTFYAEVSSPVGVQNNYRIELVTN